MTLLNMTDKDMILVLSIDLQYYIQMKDKKMFLIKLLKI